MKRRLLILLVFVAGLIGLALLAESRVSMEAVIRHEQRLREFIETNPLSGWLVGFVIYFLVSLVPGTSGKSVICGWLFGFWLGVLMVDVALTCAGLIMFLVSRYVLRDAIESRFRERVQRLREHLHREGPYYLLALRMAHAPFTVVNYVSGALPISTPTFWWTTQLGLLPGTMVFVFAGTRLPTLEVLQEQGVGRLLDPLLIAALVGTAVVPMLARWVFLRWPSKPDAREAKTAC